MAEGIEVGIYNRDSVQWIKDIQGEVAKLEGELNRLESVISTLNSTTSETEKNTEKAKKSQQELESTASSLAETALTLNGVLDTKIRLTKQDSKCLYDYEKNIHFVNASQKLMQLYTSGLTKENQKLNFALQDIILAIGAAKAKLDMYTSGQKEQAKAEKESEKTVLSAQKAEQSRIKTKEKVIKTKEKVIKSLKNESMVAKEVLDVNKSNNLTHNETKTVLNDVIKLKNKGISTESAYVSGLVDEVKNIRNAKNSLDEYRTSLKNVEQVKKNIASIYPSGEVGWIFRMSNVAKSAGDIGAASQPAVRSNPGYYYDIYRANQIYGGMNGEKGVGTFQGKLASEAAGRFYATVSNTYALPNSAMYANKYLNLQLQAQNQRRAYDEAYARRQQSVSNPINIALPGLSTPERQGLRQDAYVAFATPGILHNAQIRRFNGYSTVPFNTLGGAVANSLWQRSDTGRAIGLRVNRYGASNRFSSAPVAQMESSSENDSLSRLQLIMAYFSSGKLRELAQEYSQFKSALSSAEAVIGANADEMVRLQVSAEELGKNTVFTAGQAAEGIKYLGMAGMKTNEIVKVLPETLNLASAGELDLGRAADIATNIMSSFNMEASEFKVAADAIAYAAANSNTNVEQLAMGMKYAGPSARAAGVSLKDTTAILSTLANAGIQASTGGTSLRMVLSSLSKAPTKNAVKALKEMGLEFEDVSLKNNELISVINKLAERNMSLGQAIDIFGVRAANSMMALTSNTEKLNQMEKGLDGCAGAAKRIADIKMDNLSGDFTILTSAVSNAVIQFTKLTGAERITREVFQSMTKYINATSDSLEKFMKWAGMVPSEVTKVNKSTGEVTTAIQGITESGKFLNATMQTGVEIVGTIMGMNIANWVVRRVADIDLMRGAVERVTQGLGGLRDLWNNVLHDTQGGLLTNQTGGLSGAKLALAAPMIAYGVLKVGQIVAEVIKTESVERDARNIAYKNSKELLSMADTPTGYDEKMINLLRLNSVFPEENETPTQFFKRAYDGATSPYASPGLKEFAKLYEERDNFRANYAQQINDKKLNAKAEASARETVIRFFKKSYNAISDNITEGFDYAKAIEEVSGPLREQKKINDFIAQNKGTALLPVEIANESDLKILSDVGKGMGKSLEEMLSSNFPSIVELRKLLGEDYVAPKSGSKATAQKEKDTSGNGFVGRVMNLFMGAYNYGMRVANPYITNMSKFSDTYSSELTSNQRTRERIGIVNSVSNQTAYDKKMRDYEKELEIRKKIQEADVSEGSEAANLIRAQVELRYQLNELEEKGMERMKKSEEIYRNLSQGIADAVVNAHNLRDAFQSMGDVAVNMLKRLAVEWAESQLYKMFTRAGDKGGTGSSDSWGWIGSAVGGLTKMFGFANGGAFQNGRLTAYARGGIVNRPTIFPMAHGMGLMGEAGAEAVMPLRRTASGDLGVQVSGGSSRGSLVIAPQITINAEGGTKDENKDAADRIDSTVRQALDDMVMNVIIREQRPGGTLYR